MTPKEELIQAIQQSPDGIVQELLAMLKALQGQPLLEAADSPPVECKTVLERMGGVPRYLLSEGDLSDRDRRRALITEHLQRKYRHDR